MNLNAQKSLELTDQMQQKDRLVFHLDSRKSSQQLPHLKPTKPPNFRPGDTNIKVTRLSEQAVEADRVGGSVILINGN